MSELTPIECEAKFLFSKIVKAKNGNERASINTKGSNSVAFDFLLEKGYAVIGTTNASARAWSNWTSTSPYATKAGRNWYHDNGGLHSAAIVLTNALRNLY